jgi:hypothetical protein
MSVSWLNFPLSEVQQHVRIPVARRVRPAVLLSIHEERAWQQLWPGHAMEAASMSRCLGRSTRAGVGSWASFIRLMGCRCLRLGYVKMDQRDLGSGRSLPKTAQGRARWPTTTGCHKHCRGAGGKQSADLVRCKGRSRVGSRWMDLDVGFELSNLEFSDFRQSAAAPTPGDIYTLGVLPGPSLCLGDCAHGASRVARSRDGFSLELRLVRSAVHGIVVRIELWLVASPWARKPHFQCHAVLPFEVHRDSPTGRIGQCPPVALHAGGTCNKRALPFCRSKLPRAGHIQTSRA